MARPKEWTPDFIERVRNDLKEYIENTEIPVVSDFAWRYGYPRSRLYIQEELKDLMELMQSKKESQLEIKALKGEVNPTMAVFSLKQMGWKDRHETDNKHSITERKVVYIENENENDDV